MTPAARVPAAILIALVKSPLVVIAVVKVRHALVVVALAAFELCEQRIHQMLFGPCTVRSTYSRTQVVQYLLVINRGVIGVLQPGVRSCTTIP